MFNKQISKQNKKTPLSGTDLISAEEIISLPCSEVLDRLGTSATGLTIEEVERRLETYGSNEVVKKERGSILIEFLSHFKSPLVIILIIAAIVSGVLGQRPNAIIILSIVLVSVILDFTQEYRAERAAEELKRRVATTATTVRNGAKQDIEISELVPGDVIALSAGDIVPADARIINARDFFVDQSALTGESFPVEKTADSFSITNIADSSKWNNYLFMGTSVTNGAATAVITKTGSSTQYGEIAKKSAERKPETEFERGLRRFGFLIMQVTFALVISVFFINALFKRGVLESLLFSVALAVGLTPELMPMILSLNLAKGATAMSKKGVIVKRLASIQNFGSMDILCADKTGTLTENRVTVILHVDVEGKDSEKVFLYSLLNSRYQTGLRSPLDDAILKYKEVNTDQFQRIDEIPFDFVRRRLSVVVRENEETTLITKGSPEEIAKVILHYEFDGEMHDLTSEVRSKIERKYRDLSSQGFRVLGVSYRRMGEGKPTYSISDENDMIFLGFIAFTDPLKETAGESLELLRQAGVKLKVLTGDNEIVTGKICQQLGFQVHQFRRGIKYDDAVGHVTRTIEIEPINIIRSSEIEAVDDDALARVVEGADIFTRVTPAQKNRIMNALKANGHVVGFIGDGINDTPSMKVADVSISVTNAVDIAKESADIILLNNDLKIVSDGVVEGRKTFGNTMKYIMMAISSNFGNMFSAAGASLFLSFLPMLPIQILLNNLLYSFAQLALPTDNVDQAYVQRPQRLQASFIRNFMVAFGPVSSIFDFLTFFVMIFVFKAPASLFQTAWFVESLFTQTLVIFAIRTTKIPFYRSKPGKLLVLNIMVILGLALVLPFTFGGTFFGFVALPLKFLLILAVFIVAYLGLVELMKIWFYRRYGATASQ
ncbi:MAG TPA: magnesium-translocating P-type ATPase [Dehalococcoidia bacterium]|nr:magnesium-translocating P-type ATPase [Dehalococcoidia bacterium]